MSSKKSDSLTQLLLVANRHYAESGTIAQYGWDFENNRLQPLDSGDGLARFVCSELKDAFDPDQTPVEQMLVGASYMEKAAKELNDLASQMENFAIRQMAFQFFVWFKESKRTTITEGLIQSWMDVHPLPEVRELDSFVKAEVMAKAKLDIKLTPEELDAILEAFASEQSLSEDLDEIVQPTDPDPAAASDANLVPPPPPPTT